MRTADKKYSLTRDYCKLREMEFMYSGSTTKTSQPRVLVTSQNQYELRGFNMNYMGTVTENKIRKEWRAVQNRPWPTATKERVVLDKVGGRAKTSFRSYKTDRIIKFT